MGLIVIKSVTDFADAIKRDLSTWDSRTTPWFRGESGSDPALQPKVATLNEQQENHLLQSFRRRAGSLGNTPSRSETDKWIFLAQHYGLATRLLDWSEGALFALFFAINKLQDNPRVYMLNPHVLNAKAFDNEPDFLNFPISWSPSPDNQKPGYENIALAWEARDSMRGYDLPVALEPTYQDMRMIAQRSAFTVHGRKLGPLESILEAKHIPVSDCLFTYEIDHAGCKDLVRELSWLGISHASIFPDLDHLCKDIRNAANSP